MFCVTCGTENADGANFCKSCGSPLMKGVATPKTSGNAVPAGTMGAVPKTAAPVGAPGAAGTQMPAKQRNMPVAAIIGCAVAALVFLLVILPGIVIVISTLRSTYNLSPYLKIEATGCDGYGTARVSIDWDAFERKYGERLSLARQPRGEFSILYAEMTPTEILCNAVMVNLEPSNRLKNGDEIAYTWSVDESLLSCVKGRFKYKDGVYNVTGLTKVDTFDAFADLSVSFDGIAPNGQLNMTYQGTELDQYDFRCETTSGLSNGDTVKISLPEDRMESYAETLGKVPETLEKEYTVSGLSAYVARRAEIGEESLAGMIRQGEDVYRAHFAQNQQEGSTLESLSCIGDYLLTAKSADGWGSRNLFYVVYKAQVRNQYANEGASYDKVSDVYWFLCYENLLAQPDGILDVDLTNYSTPGASFTVDSMVSFDWFGTREWRMYGYPTVQALYQEAVMQKIDAYNHEDQVDESSAPVTKVETPAASAEEPAASEEMPAAQEENAAYIFPDSDTRLLTKQDLEGLSAEECKKARNEIYARHGRRFKDAALQSYFDSCDWYEGTIEPDDFQENQLSKIEIANKNLIADYEKEKGYR